MIASMNTSFRTFQRNEVVARDGVICHAWDDVPLRLVCWALKRAWWLRELEL